jgi:hypothetical protein
MVVELEVGQIVADDRLAAVAFRAESKPSRSYIPFSVRKRGLQDVDQVDIEILAEALLDLRVDQAQTEDALQHVLPVNRMCKALEGIVVQIGDDVLEAGAEYFLALQLGSLFSLAPVILREGCRQPDYETGEQANLLEGSIQNGSPGIR